MNKIYFSERKLDVFKFITKYFKENEYTPTFAEIAKNLGFTRSRANAIVNDLVKIGLIDKETDASQRKIRLSKNQINILNKLKFN
ncbi:MarR family transcriptional regulator, partial [Candidatus Woesearchaeota archaeon]|nr:MarR family transcriptional regulator [Candidatus Woesearchaeota archaeon]